MYTHRGQGDVRTEEREISRGSRLEDWSHGAKSQEMLAVRSWKRRGMASPLNSLEGMQLCEHLVFNPVMLISDF